MYLSESVLFMLLKSLSHSHGASCGSPWFELDSKIRVNHRKFSITTVCKGFLRILVWFPYGSSTKSWCITALQTAIVVRFGTSTTLDSSTTGLP